MKPFKTVALAEILSPSEIERAKELYREDSDESFNSRLVRELIEPNMARINAATGQENDARFIGYAIEYCLLQETRGKRDNPSGTRRDRKWSRGHAA